MNNGEVIKSLEKIMEAKETSKGVQVKKEVQAKLTSSLAWTLGASCTKLDAHDAYKLQFRHSTHTQKRYEHNLTSGIGFTIKYHQSQ